jgi:hypothetical protein
MKIAILANPSIQRSCHVARAMRDGLLCHGVVAPVEEAFKAVSADVVIAYGWSNKAVFEAYRSAGKQFVYIDLGFWRRKDPGKRLDGFHKVVVNGWCPTATMRRGCPSDRYVALDLPPPQRPHGEKKVVVAGMSAKSAADHNLLPEVWETETIARIARQTERKVVYRPKPSWVEAKPLERAEFSHGESIEAVLASAHALVTHHSNAAVDAIAAGVPVYCKTGVGSLLSTVSLDDIENPCMPTAAERQQLLYDVAYLQWNVDEMRNGSCWDNIRGLL